MEGPAPRVLVLAVGNESRGDDALGPLLARRLEELDLPGVRVLADFQLQVEHALEMDGAARVLFVDAARGLAGPFSLAPVAPAAGRTAFSHALAPAAVLAVFEQVLGRPAPPAWVLGVAGESFELGEGLSPQSAAAAEQAWALLQRLLARAADWDSELTAR
ncbi:hydrogenase maturation protease [Pseudothauera rhizosphaerae]|uniref:Hydrogenase maturation protease n=1 Tax=Pseudothauera rhizosphaerae TaxID=2565932 RepID=A0A4S4AVM4_9RHOO|nr:hydrogenase maturation protease [Pseudothauera rhizosphaerae]THF62596.1 hydrogenase maturation protease [Pseudothauera rhizosphaerae]